MRCTDWLKRMCTGPIGRDSELYVSPAERPPATVGGMGLLSHRQLLRDLQCGGSSTGAGHLEKWSGSTLGGRRDRAGLLARVDRDISGRAGCQGHHAGPCPWVLILRQGSGALMNRGPTGVDQGHTGMDQGFMPMMADPAMVLGKVVRAWKARSTRLIRRTCDPGFAWQSRYYEHIIRSPAELERIRNYIELNPLKERH